MLHAMFSLLHFQSRFLMPFGAYTEERFTLITTSFHQKGRKKKRLELSLFRFDFVCTGTVENFTSSDVCLITKPILPVALRSHLCGAHRDESFR
jgi:hypothetical protein